MKVKSLNLHRGGAVIPVTCLMGASLTMMTMLYEPDAEARRRVLANWEALEDGDSVRL